MEGLLIWYGLGVIGSVLAREAFASAWRANGWKPEPFTVKTVIVGALFSLTGPVTLMAAALWWICAFFEHKRAGRWRWTQPIRRVLNYKLFE